jgi:hypothetical protein
MFAGDLRYQTQPVLEKLANIAEKKECTGASFYLMAKPTNFTKIEHYLRMSYQAHQRPSPYSR